MAESLGGVVRTNRLILFQVPGSPGGSNPNDFFGVAGDPNGNVSGQAGDRAYLLGGASSWICSGGTVWVDTTSIVPTEPGRVVGVVATFDPSANVSQRATGNHNLGVNIPEGVVVTNTFYRIVTDVTSAGNLATVGMGYTVDDVVGLVTSLAINDGTNPYTAGAAPLRARNHLSNGDLPVQLSVPTTGIRSLQVSVGVEPLLTGKLEFYVQYTILLP